MVATCKIDFSKLTRSYTAEEFRHISKILTSSKSQLPVTQSTRVMLDETFSMLLLFYFIYLFFFWCLAFGVSQFFLSFFKETSGKYTTCESLHSFQNIFPAKVLKK